MRKKHDIRKDEYAEKIKSIVDCLYKSQFYKFKAYISADSSLSYVYQYLLEHENDITDEINLKELIYKLMYNHYRQIKLIYKKEIVKDTSVLDFINFIVSEHLLLDFSKDFYKHTDYKININQMIHSFIKCIKFPLLWNSIDFKNRSMIRAFAWKIYERMEVYE